MCVGENRIGTRAKHEDNEESERKKKKRKKEGARYITKDRSFTHIFRWMIVGINWLLSVRSSLY